MNHVLYELLDFQVKKAEKFYQEWIEADNAVDRTEKLIAQIEKVSPTNVN